MSQADNAGTVTSGEAVSQALAAEGGEVGSTPAAAAGPLAGEGPTGEGLSAGASIADDLDQDDLGGEDDLDQDDLGGEDSLAEASGEASDEDGRAGTPELSMADLEQESEVAADYVEGLLDVADLDGDIDMDVEGDRAVVSVVGATLQELIGPRGEVLEALQELTRLAVHRQTGARTRIMLDVGGYRAKRRMELTELGRDAADEVQSSGLPRRLDAMTPFERKIVHDAVAAAGLRSESEGEEPNRRVVVFPAG